MFLGFFSHVPVAAVEAFVYFDDWFAFDSYDLFHFHHLRMVGVTSFVLGHRLTIYKTYIYINIVVLEYIGPITAMLI